MVCPVDELKASMRERENFLDEIWLSDKKFYKVSVEVGGDYLHHVDYQVKEGEPCPTFPTDIEKRVIGSLVGRM